MLKINDWKVIALAVVMMVGIVAFCRFAGMDNHFMYHTSTIPHPECGRIYRVVIGGHTYYATNQEYLQRTLGIYVFIICLVFAVMLSYFIELDKSAKKRKEMEGKIPEYKPPRKPW